VFQSLGHFFHFTGRKEGDRIPVPVKVEDVAVQFDGVVRRDHMFCKEPLATWRDGNLLGTFPEMYFRVSPISALDAGSCCFRYVDYKEALA
jgi:hypothetical protein